MHIRLILLILFHFIFLSYTLKNLRLNSNILKRNSIFYNSIQSQSISVNDRNKLLDIILSISDNIDTDPEKSMLTISQELGWLLSHNIPSLADDLMKSKPLLKSDSKILRSYSFLLDFLEAIVNETDGLLKRRQGTLRKIMEAAKTNEIGLDKFMSENIAEISDPEFLVYLDSEIENQDTNSPMENFLVTMKLRILDEIGKSKGVDITVIPKLAAAKDFETMQLNTYKYLEDFNTEEKVLFQQMIKLLQNEMKKKYVEVDKTLLENLYEIEKIVKEIIKIERQ